MPVIYIWKLFLSFSEMWEWENAIQLCIILLWYLHTECLLLSVFCNGKIAVENFFFFFNP